MIDSGVLSNYVVFIRKENKKEVQINQVWISETEPEKEICLMQQVRAGGMGWIRLVGSLKLLFPFAKEPYKRDYVLQKKPIISRSLLMVATPQHADVSSEPRASQ